MTLPLRMAQASATAAAEQWCAVPIRASVGSARECRCRLRAGGRPSLACRAGRPMAENQLNAATLEVVSDLISRTAMAIWNTEELFYVTDLEVGHTPSTNFLCRA